MPELIKYAVAFLAMSTAANSSLLYEVAYHNFNAPNAHVLLSIIIEFIIAFTLVATAHLFNAKRVAAGIALIAALYFSRKAARALALPQFLEQQEKVVLFGFLSACAIIIIMFATERLLKRLVFALCGFAVVWSLTPIASNLFYRSVGGGQFQVFDSSMAIQEKYRANVVLIFDELSPQYVTPITEKLNSLGLSSTIGFPTKAGDNTINAIPSMLTGEIYADVSPCSSTALCGTNYVDFSMMYVNSSGVHIVGFYHPYCSINGLASCALVDANQIEGPLDYGSLLVSLLKHAPVLSEAHVFKKIIMEADSTRNQERYRKAQSLLRSYVMSSPFWDEGGILMIHYLGPHPSVGGRERDLLKHYKENIDDASGFAADVASKLVARFGSDFNLIVTSDHPLRSWWCDYPFYESDTCRDSIPIEGSYVPYVSVTFGENDHVIPQHMTGLLGGETE